MTLPEVLLWQELKAGQIGGFKFVKQKPIGSYIVDFFCKELSLAIEVDGSYHDDIVEYDEQRQAEIEKLGVIFLRFTAKEVLGEMDWVVNEIDHKVEELGQGSSPSPHP